jgi:hypothetical protein
VIGLAVEASGAKAYAGLGVGLDSGLGPGADAAFEIGEEGGGDSAGHRGEHDILSRHGVEGEGGGASAPPPYAQFLDQIRLKPPSTSTREA